MAGKEAIRRIKYWMLEVGAKRKSRLVWNRKQKTELRILSDF
jgi:hypothetical protein